MSGGGGSSTTVQKADPWEGVQPFLRQGFSDTSQLYSSQAPQYYPGATTATMGPIQEAGNLSAINFAATGAPDLYNLGLGSLQSILGGGGTGNVYATGAAPTMTGVDASFRLDPNAQQTVQDLMAARDPSLNPAFATAQQLAGQSDPTKLLGYDQIQALQSASDPTANLGYGAVQQLLGQGDPSQMFGAEAVNRLLAAGDPTTNPYFQGTLAASLRPVTQAFQEEILPGIRTNFGAMGQYGGSRQGIAEGLAAGRANQQMADIAASMGNQAYSQGLQAMQAGGALGANFSNLAQQGLTAGGQLGSQITGQQLQGLGQAGALGQQVQGQALGNLATGGGMLANIYGQGLGAAQAGAGLEYERESQAKQLAAEQARASAQIQAASANASAANRNAQLQAQLQAVQMLPMLGNLGLQQSNILSGIGGQYQSQEQNLINADMARWNYENQQPYNMLNDYMTLLQGGAGMGGTSSMTQPMTSSPLRGAAGGAMTGAAIGSAVPIVGTGVGAGIGGLLGLMGVL